MEIAFLLLMVVLAAEPASSCICRANYDPVCGKDGHTYSNACEASCSGVSVAHQGDCRERATTPSPGRSGSCICRLNIDPVCGTDGRTYNNRCQAGCSGVSIAHEGNCQQKATTISLRRSCICPLVYRQVCGTDGKTYNNECQAGCSGVSVASQSKCRGRKTTKASPSKRCVCPRNNEPVCGADGKTYGNTCKATCRGVSVASQGKCRRRKSTTASPSKRCVCPAIYRPVCGTDGKTYGNTCEAACRGVDAVDGACEVPKLTRRPTPAPRSCMCITIYAPVCGTDGRTYSNSCQADCSGVSVAKQGGCQSAGQFSQTADIRDPSV